MIEFEPKTPDHHPHLVWQEVDDGVVIVTPQQGKVRALNHLGSLVWKMIDGHKSLQHIYVQLCQSYAVVPVEQIASDLEAFMDDLDKRDLIVWHERA